MSFWLGTQHFIFAEFTARNKTPEQNSHCMLFKGLELFYMFSSSIPLLVETMTKTAFVRLWLTISASSYSVPQRDQHCFHVLAKAKLASSVAPEFMLVDLIT